VLIDGGGPNENYAIVGDMGSGAGSPSLILNFGNHLLSLKQLKFET